MVLDPETGQLVIDPNSLTMQAQAPVQYVRRDDNDDVLINSMSHMRREASTRWTPEETEEFYVVSYAVIMCCCLGWSFLVLLCLVPPCSAASMLHCPAYVKAMVLGLLSMLLLYEQLWERGHQQISAAAISDFHHCMYCHETNGGLHVVLGILVALVHPDNLTVCQRLDRWHRHQQAASCS